MSTTSDTSHRAAILDAALTAAWLTRCGPSGKPDKWMIPGEYLPVIDGSTIEVEAYPIYAKVEDGRPTMWGAHMGPSKPGVVHAWDWRINVGWNDLTDREIEQLEDLGGCLDDYHTTFVVLGSHDERPPVPDGFLEAWAMADA